MKDVRNGFVAAFLPFLVLMLFWQFVVRKDHWSSASSDKMINFKKIVGYVLPFFLLLWAVVGISLTYKYASERRELSQLGSKGTHFEVRPRDNPLAAPYGVPEDTARKAADKISFSKLKDTINAIKKKDSDSKEYDAFLKELQYAYGSGGIVSPKIPIPTP
jgi:hypothetical protein